MSRIASPSHDPRSTRRHARTSCRSAREARAPSMLQGYMRLHHAAHNLSQASASLRSRHSRLDQRTNSEIGAASFFAGVGRLRPFSPSSGTSPAGGPAEVKLVVAIRAFGSRLWSATISAPGHKLPFRSSRFTLGRAGQSGPGEVGRNNHGTLHGSLFQYNWSILGRKKDDL